MAELFGMIHLPSLKINSKHTIPDIIEYAVSQAVLLDELGYDGVVIENFGDIPFAKVKVDDVVVSKLSLICHEVRKEIGGKIGLNILRNATIQSMKVASVVGLDFVRSNIWESAYVTDQGIIEGVAFEVMEAKSQLNSDVEVYADIFVKHATPLADFTVLEAAEQALGRGGADRIIISGRHTGGEVDFTMLQILNDAGIYPVIGSGLNLDNLKKFKGKISAGIIGSAIKENEVTSPINMEKAKTLAQQWITHFK